MIQFTHYSQATFNGDGKFSFRHYSLEKKLQRFAAYVSNELPHYEQADTEGLTSLEGFYNLRFDTFDMNDSITYIGLPFSMATGFSKKSISKIIYSANLTSILHSYLSLTFDDSCTELVHDFSRCKQIPVCDNGSLDLLNKAAKIIVPANLYESWISHPDWASAAAIIESAS